MSTMKTRFTWLGVVATLLVTISTFFVACNKDDMNDVIVYRGQVVYINTTTPFPNLQVKVTNGTDTHCQSQTDEGGNFTLKVRVNEIDGNYYLLAGDSTCVPKQVALGGYGQAEVDLGVIEVEGPALPTVKTTPVTEVTAEGATLGGEVMTSGRLAITARGICYGTAQQPTIEDSHTTDGSGLGAFTSTLKNLEHNTIYYARAYATNKMGTSYGEQVKFTTELGVPIVVTDSIIRITAHSAKCKGHVESDGGYKVTTRGTCWSKRPDPTIDDDCTNDGSDKGEFTSTLNNLIENTTYYVRTYATNSTATVYGEQIIITTLDGLAVVKTDSVNNVTATGFTAFGTVVYDCDIDVTARGFCYATTQYPTIDNEHTTSGKGLGSFKSTVSQLEYGTTYYIRAYATNATETTYGEQFTITTLSGLPTVTTADVTNIGSVKATCGGEVTDDGTLTVTARGVCYGKEQQPTIDDSHTTDGKGKGTFTSSIKGLEDKTTYYVRAYATTDAGTAYGEQKTFMTENGVPVVILSNLGEPTANSITCKGEVTGDGGVSLTERGFCYSTTQYPTNTDRHVAVGTGMGEFSGSLTGLAINTTYYVRAYAINSLGVGYSEQQSFTTKDGLAVVTTGQATSTATTINANGEVTNNGGFNVSERGICYSDVNSEPTIADSKIAAGSGNGTFATSITGLSASKTYYIRAYATNTNGTAYGAAQTIQTKNGAAVVTTGTITGITALSAKCSATVTDADGATLQSCGICWATTPNPTIDNSINTGGNQINTAYTCNMSDLTPNTKYYVRAYATTDITTTYGEQVSFTTVSGLPAVSTGVPTATATSMVAKGEVTDNGGYNVTERGFCYSATNAEPSLTDTKITSGSGNGSFSASIKTLKASTKYYVRAYATNSIGTSYGNIVSVTTKNGAASVTTGSIKNITALSASGSVTVTDAAGATLQSCGICWATIPNPTISNNKTAGGNQLNTAYNCNMTGLTPSTTYYVRSYATTDITTTYGEQVTFNTVSGLPAVATNPTTATSTTITSGGNITSDGGYSITVRGVCYSTGNSMPTLSDSYTEAGTGTGSFSTTITNVSVSTTYYVRAYATNSIGTGYGEVITITTNDGKPQLTTTTPTLNGTTVITGGHITSDENYSITARGICYGSLPNPDLSSAYNHTNDGTGTGYYSSTFSLPYGSGIYYIRAYATNVNGTAYGEQVTIIQPYDELPVFSFNGKTYKVAPDPSLQSEFLSFSDAYSYCENLNAYGFTDWRMPTYDELLAMYHNKSTIGGFYVNASSYNKIYYWSSTNNPLYDTNDCHLWINFSSGTSNEGTCNDYGSYSDQHTTYYRIHVRPIRVEQ